MAIRIELPRKITIPQTQVRTWCGILMRFGWVVLRCECLLFVTALLVRLAMLLLTRVGLCGSFWLCLYAWIVAECGELELTREALF